MYWLTVRPSGSLAKSGVICSSATPTTYTRRAAVWNSGCFTASPGLGHYGLNINGRSVLEMEDSSSHLLDRDRVR